jgi:hypothetical protein
MSASAVSDGAKAASSAAAAAATAAGNNDDAYAPRDAACALECLVTVHLNDASVLKQPYFNRGYVRAVTRGLGRGAYVLVFDRFRDVSEEVAIAPDAAVWMTLAEVRAEYTQWEEADDACAPDVLRRLASYDVYSSALLLLVVRGVRPVACVRAYDFISGVDDVSESGRTRILLMRCHECGTVLPRVPTYDDPRTACDACLCTWFCSQACRHASTHACTDPVLAFGRLLSDAQTILDAWKRANGLPSIQPYDPLEITRDEAHHRSRAASAASASEYRTGTRAYFSRLVETAGKSTRALPRDIEDDDEDDDGETEMAECKMANTDDVDDDDVDADYDDERRNRILDSAATDAAYEGTPKQLRAIMRAMKGKRPAPSRETRATATIAAAAKSSKAPPASSAPYTGNGAAASSSSAAAAVVAVARPTGAKRKQPTPKTSAASGSTSTSSSSSSSSSAAPNQPKPTTKTKTKTKKTREATALTTREAADILRHTSPANQIEYGRALANFGRVSIPQQLTPDTTHAQSELNALRVLCEKLNIA